MRHLSSPALPALFLALWIAAGCRSVESSVPASLQRAKPAHTHVLSVDDAAAPSIRRCLADTTGRVPRFTDDEPFGAVDPRDTLRIIAVWQTRSGAGSVIQWVRSEDGG